MIGGRTIRGMPVATPRRVTSWETERNPEDETAIDRLHLALDLVHAVLVADGMERLRHPAARD